MKKIFLSLLVCLFALPMSLFAQSYVLLNEEWVCADDWSTYQCYYLNQLPDLAADDKIQIEVTAVSSGVEWPQVYIQYVDANWNWVDFASDEPHNICVSTSDALPETVEITLTKSMVDKVLAGQCLIVKGAGYTADKITYVHNNPLPAGILWEGEKVMPSSWGAWLPLPASKFADVKVGDVLRMCMKDVSSGAMGQFSTASWTAFPDAPCKSVGGRYYEYTVTADMLAELQANGVNINGCGYTLTAVKVIDPTTAVNYSKELSIGQKDWTWTDSKPVVGVKVGNPSSEATTIPVDVEVTTDKGEAVATYSQNVELAANETGKQVDFTLDDITNPGIYRISAYVNDESVSYTRSDNAYTWTSLNIAYKPEEIVSAPDAQSDFADYWTKAKEQLKSVDMNAQLTLVEEGTSRNLYTVTLNSVPNGTSGEPVQIRGYYAEPKGEGKFPCIIYYQGYDSDDSSDPWHFTADSNPDYAELIISARGQSFGNRGDYKSDNIYCNTTGANTDDNIKDGKWFSWHFGDLDSYYYRGAYLDQVRGIDFIYSRDKVDTQNVFCTGGSQGGAFTLVASALSDGRVNAICPAIQFMGDFPDYFLVGSWPGNEAKSAAAMKNMSDEDMYKFLSYFDTKNFASMITSPTLSSIGLQDNVCPAHTNLAPYNLLTCEKTLYINKNLVHEVPYGESNGSDYNWNNLTADWWKAHMKTTDGISTVNANSAKTGKFINDGRVVIVNGDNMYTTCGQQLK